MSQQYTRAHSNNGTIDQNISLLALAKLCSLSRSTTIAALRVAVAASRQAKSTQHILDGAFDLGKKIASGMPPLKLSPLLRMARQKYGSQ